MGVVFALHWICGTALAEGWSGEVVTEDDEEPDAPPAEDPAPIPPLSADPPPTDEAATTQGPLPLAPEVEADAPLGPIDLSQATPLGPLTAEQQAWLKPRRSDLDPNPYAQTDFTAYTLEWGEVRLGLAGIAAGLLPRFQVGTSLPLDVLGVPNGNAKINAVRAGPLDLGLLGHHFDLRSGDFHSTYTGVGTNASIILTQAWSLHGSALVNRVRATGLPDLEKLSPFLTRAAGAEIDAYTLAVAQATASLDVKATALTVDVATDIRFNRRDSIILRGQTMAWRDVYSTAGIDPALLPPVLGMDQWLDVDESGPVPVTHAYVASAAYHIAWRGLDLRMGLGVSSMPAAWLLQSTDLSLRFGGATRRQETRLIEAWSRPQEEAALPPPEGG